MPKGMTTTTHTATGEDSSGTATLTERLLEHGQKAVTLEFSNYKHTGEPVVWKLQNPFVGKALVLSADAPDLRPVHADEEQEVYTMNYDVEWAGEVIINHSVHRLAPFSELHDKGKHEKAHNGIITIVGV
jgi:hypothetical protein